MPASFSACVIAATPNPAARERCRRACWSGTYDSMSKSLTMPPMRTGNVPASKVVIGPTPLRPASSACQVLSTSLPTGVTAPMPVIATRLAISQLLFV
jgi:hypothetical protein